jgi:hypothetical protein
MSAMRGLCGGALKIIALIVEQLGFTLILGHPGLRARATSLRDHCASVLPSARTLDPRAREGRFSWAPFSWYLLP